jgi:hypothetical protein
MRKLLILTAMASLALQGEPLQAQKKNKDYYKDINDALGYFKSDRATDKSFALATLGLVGQEARKQNDPKLAQFLAKTSSKITVEGMVTNDPAIRKAANEAIGSVNPTIAGPVTALVNGQSYDQRLQGVKQLSQLGPDAVAAVPALMSFLKQAKPEDTGSVVQSIGVVGAKDPQVAELIAVMAMKDPNPAIQNAALATLGKMPGGDSTVGLFLSTLNNDRDPKSRMSAIQGLAAVGKNNPGAVAELQKLAGMDPNPDVKAAAQAALGKLQKNQ